MRRILPLIVLVGVLGSLSAAGAWAQSEHHGVAAAHGESVASRVAAPFSTPNGAPHRDSAQQGFVYGYRSGASIGAEMQAAAAPHQRAAAPASGATIQVTAIVLPTVTVELTRSGDVAALVVNTDARDARDIVFVLPRALDAATWRQVRSALAHAHAGTGTVWAA
jgi:hypothetical protein